MSKENTDALAGNDMNVQTIRSVYRNFGDLSDSEVRELIGIYQETGNMECRNRVIMAHLGEIPKVVNARYYFKDRPRSDYEDACANATLMLFTAIERYDVTSTASFSTYLRFWVQKAVSDFFRKNNASIESPYTNKKKRIVENCMNYYALEFGRKPTNDEILAYSEGQLTEKSLKEILRTENPETKSLSLMRDYDRDWNEEQKIEYAKECRKLKDYPNNMPCPEDVDEDVFGVQLFSEMEKCIMKENMQRAFWSEARSSYSSEAVCFHGSYYANYEPVEPFVLEYSSSPFGKESKTADMEYIILPEDGFDLDVTESDPGGFCIPLDVFKQTDVPGVWKYSFLIVSLVKDQGSSKEPVTVTILWDKQKCCLECRIDRITMSAKNDYLYWKFSGKYVNRDMLVIFRMLTGFNKYKIMLTIKETAKLLGKSPSYVGYKKREISKILKKFGYSPEAFSEFSPGQMF